MGYGVYREDYKGLGRSINVRSPSTTDEQYETYVADCRENGDDPSTREEYDKDEYDNANEGMISIVESAAEEVGLGSVLEGRFGKRKSDFDKDVTSIADGDVVDVGWRSWSGDFVIAIGPCMELDRQAVVAGDDGRTAGFDPGYVVAMKGRDPDRFAADYKALLDDFERLLRLSLMKGGHETAVPTSSYTSRADEAPADIDAEVETLEGKVRGRVTALSRDFEEALSTASVEERLDVARAVEGMDRTFQEIPVLLGIPAYDAAGDRILLWAPDDTGEERAHLAAIMPAPAGMGAYLAALPEVDGMFPVPFEAGTGALYSTLQRSVGGEAVVVVSAEQYCEATSRDCVVTRSHQDGTRRDSTLHEAAPAPAP